MGGDEEEIRIVERTGRFGIKLGDIELIPSIHLSELSALGEFEYLERLNISKPKNEKFLPLGFENVEDLESELERLKELI